MSVSRIAISDGKGKWIEVPSLDVAGNIIVVEDRWLKIARVHRADWLETEIANPEACIHALRDNARFGLCADIFTFSQKLPSIQPKYSYPLEWESLAAARATFKKWWNQLPQETRKNVRRAQRRGVYVTVRTFDDDVVRAIISVNDNAPVRQGSANVHYGKTFDQAKRDYGAFLDRSEFFCANFENEIIGFIKVVYRGDVASILNLAAKPSHYDKRPVNALLAKVIERCEEKGILYLIYGMFNYGNKRNGSLREFKVRNGFEEVLVPRYYVPLTRWGRMCMGLKLHRGLIGILPNRAIDIGIGLRARLYSFKGR